MKRRAVLTWCPVLVCNAVQWTAGVTDPGLMWLKHFHVVHPELVYAPNEIAKRELEQQLRGRLN